MIDILALLQCLQPILTKTTVRQMRRILFAMLAMTGRVTMLGISRWAGQGGSYRTVQRFFYTVIPWAQVFWSFFGRHVLCQDDVYLLAGDECVVTKSGKHTFGLDRFFSSLYGKPIPGLSFFTLSPVSTRERRSFPIQVEQAVRTQAAKAAQHAKTKVQKPKQPAQKRKPGRPKGSKNKNKAGVSLTPELLRIQAMVQAQLQLIGGLIPLADLVLDGHFGNNNALQMARQCGLHLISKLRHDAALYFPYDGPYSGHGPRRKYGARLDCRNIPDRYLKQTSVEEHMETRMYQAQMLHKEFSQPLNVVIIVKTNLRTGARAHVILFSSDLALPYDKLIDYYCLRFQIEFNFRDAKQYWGLEDFMNVSETAVTNAANLSLFMVNFAYCLLHDFRQSDPHCSVLDLKAHFRAYKYLEETLKMLPEMPEPIFVKHIFSNVACLGRIHKVEPYICPS
jgi:putative transposase